MEEEKKVVAGENTSAKAENPTPAAPKTGNRNYEPHGSYSAARPGDRKFGDRKGRPGERRGGRGGFRREEDEYQDRVVNINRVCRVVQGGKHVRFDALVVVGDGNGKYGYALRKSGEVPDAIKKSLVSAKKAIHHVHIVKNGSIAHETTGTFASTSVFLKPAPAGTGIIAGGAVRAILELAGIKNVVSKVYGSRTPVNVLHATTAALDSLKEYDKIMVLRGLKTPEEIKAMHPAPAAKAERPHFQKANRPFNGPRGNAYRGAPNGAPKAEGDK